MGKSELHSAKKDGMILEKKEKIKTLYHDE